MQRLYTPSLLATLNAPPLMPDLPCGVSSASEKFIRAIRALRTGRWQLMNQNSTESGTRLHAVLTNSARCFQTDVKASGREWSKK